MDWIRLEIFDADDKDLQTERKKFEDVAMDMALIPERNVRVVELNDNKAALEISREMDSCMKGF